MNNNLKKSQFFNKLFHNENLIIYKILVITLLFLSIIVIVILRPITKIIIPQIGMVVNNDIIADVDTKYINKEETEKNIDEIKQKSPPVFIFDISISEKRIKNITSVFDKLLIFNNDEEIIDLFNKNLISLSKDEIHILKDIIDDEPNFMRIFTELYLKFSKNGIINENIVKELKTEKSGVLVITNINNKVDETLYSQKEIVKFYLNNKELRDEIEVSFFNLDKNKKYLLFSLYNKLVVPNIIFDKNLTNLKLENQIKSQSIVYNTIKKGQIIARKGDVITEENIGMIIAINDNLKSNFAILKILSLFFVIFSFFIFSYFFMIMSEFDFFSQIENLIFFSMLLFIFILCINIPLFMNFDSSNIFYGFFIPIATISFTFTFLYSRSISIFITIITSLIFFVISEYNVPSFLFVFFSGIGSIFLMKKISKRSELLRTGIFISILNLFIALFIILTIKIDKSNIIPMFVIAFFNGVVSSIFALGFISIGELFLNTPTIFRLQELSDLSSPLMKELFNSAIGTYNHSIIVANLAETAANEIGANGLLSKIGGYYHDIGKIDNSEYFIENQGEYNIHDELKPSISVTIIKSHLKKGIERGKKHKLPKKIVEIISQHHGNSLIKFFYDKAQKECDSTKEDVKEDFYHYNGVKPQFPESAIVLLADQVEAAIRSLKKTSLVSIEKMVDTIIYKNYEEGILDDSGLTLKDISKIKQIFVKLLTGMYHSRIEYPDTNPIKKIEQNNSEQNNATN